ncbi:MAG: hypothetical protein DME46_10395, partial [Verrucomicrobia bacterium]
MRGMAEETMSMQQAEQVDHQLVRGIGIPALTANIVSSTIGAGIFVIPATVAQGLGPAAPLAFVCCAIAMVLFVTCFAIAGSRVSLTGGLYAYVEVAFGRYVGFLAGVLYGLTALGAVAGVVNVLVNSVAVIAPFLGDPVMRIVVMLLVYGSLVLINIRGVREGAGAVTVITFAKVLPLLLFIGVGIFFIHPVNLTWSAWPGSKALGDSVILLIFAFVGIEVALIPSGEVKNPSRTVPRAAYLALVITTIIYIMIQLVAQGTLGSELANYKDAPLAEAAAKFLGNIGRTVLLAGATISAFGFVTSDILSSPRMIFAFVGIEVALIPSGEVKNPSRTVPRAAYLALVITTIIYIMIQLVAQGTLGSELANYKDAPLAEAAAKFLGNIGRTVLLAGATISAFGFVTSDILSSPRMIFAFGRDGALPAWFAHVHPRYRSPDVAIITYAVLAFALSITGTFEKLAVLSNVAVLLMYLLCCAACWFLVQRDVRADGAQPFNF